LILTALVPRSQNRCTGFHNLPLLSLIVVYRLSGKLDHSQHRTRTNIGSNISSRLSHTSILLLPRLRHRLRLLVDSTTSATSMVAGMLTGADSSLRAVTIFWKGFCCARGCLPGSSDRHPLSHAWYDARRFPLKVSTETVMILGDELKAITCSR
jgi:hypothetical protein